MKKEANKTLLISSVILGLAAIILITVSILGQFKTNWVLIAGLSCIVLGNIINVIAIIKSKKK